MHKLPSNFCGMIKLIIIKLQANYYCNRVSQSSFKCIFICINTLTLLTKALHLVCNAQQHLFVNEWLIQLQLNLLGQEFTMHFVTKATPIGNIDGRCFTVNWQKFTVKKSSRVAKKTNI